MSSSEGVPGPANDKDRRLNVLKKVQNLNLKAKLEQSGKSQVTKASTSQERSDSITVTEKASTSHEKRESSAAKEKPKKRPRKRSSRSSTSSVLSPFSLARPPVQMQEVSLSRVSAELSAMHSATVAPPTAQPQPLVVTPAETFEGSLERSFVTGTGSAVKPISAVDTGRNPPTEDAVKVGQPMLLINEPFQDITQKQWEIEQLYLRNLAILEQQRRYTKMLEHQLLKMERKLGKMKKPSKVEVYRRFLGYVVEPEAESEPSINIIGLSGGSPQHQVLDIGDGSSRPVLKPEYDIYSSYLQ